MARRLRAEEMKIVEVRRGRPFLSVDATIGEHLYEFTRLGPTSRFEVYDHPSEWEGIPRFLGYLKPAHGEQLDQIISRYEVR